MGSYANAAGTNQRPFIMRVGKNYKSDLIDGGAVYPGDYPGKVYYVNNITGSSSNDGLSWNKAFAQLSTAITASETQRALYTGTTNDYVRNVIYVQGTGTMYTYLTALPSYCDVIGVGADPRGDGTGIVVVGSIGAYDGAAGSMRGTNWYNIQFVTGDNATSAFHATVAYRSGFYNCTFGTSASSAAAPANGLEVTSGSGLVVSNCAVVMHASVPTTGFNFASAGGNFNQCLIEDNLVYGSTTGILNTGYLCNGTLFRNNTCYGGTNGISDQSTESTLAGNAFYAGNYASGGTQGMTLAQNGTKRAIGNWVIANTTAQFITAIVA